MDIKFISSIFFLFQCLPCLFAQPVIHVADGYSAKYIGREVEIFQDTSNRLTVEDILAGRGVFERSNSEVLNFGTSEVNNWIRFTIFNDTDYPQLILSISNPTIEEVALFKLAGAIVDSVPITTATPYVERDYHHQFFAHNLVIPRGDSATFYLRLRSTTQLLVPLMISDSRNFIKAVGGFDIRSGIYIGVMLAMLLYNLFLYFSARDRHYLIYVHYIFWVTAAQVALLGYFDRFFQWIEIPNGYVVTFFGAMSGIASVFFVKSFLNIKNYSKYFNGWLNLIIVGDLIAIALLFLQGPSVGYSAVNLVAGSGSLIVLIIAYITYRRGNRPAKLFLIAWGIFLGSVITFVLKDYGMLSYSLLTVHAVQIGSLVEALLLSFALGDKINLYRKEKEDSQARALLMSKENEKLIREQNIILEQRVEERTHALKESNESLQKTLTYLKETQAQLVEAEKMASLGQLTAGVAHEINNPINFVTSNVAPLRRDINMIWDTLSEIERIACADSSIEEKKRYINTYKDELDFDYLKEEIDFLLKGMHEGANRTAEIVKSLRIFSRVDEDSLKFADINEGLESTLVILNSVVKEGVHVAKHYADLPHIECYPGKLNQVFLNIITNALYAINKKFEGRPGGLLEIKTGVDAVNVYISIKDNGIGMPADVQEKIFEPFFTTKEVGEGTGLGMSIAYNTIKKHQGEIKIESEVGEGTNFILIIPLRQQMH
ncbi:hypothetical protein SAMN05660226_01598 [Parapedobacter luteus]|uniref:histidine kinase n=1 Tax=Parapedobacter luteus TaxID=623280 RepID=A0A1T5BMN6_9SPHI|nr:7TM diverse intracellular signaling domain-containing protein [Parapedobacter luteus]SKB48526.1 hypothetical protein SAMN05660226_01598 [Parapedobacter luteus]